MSSYEDRCFKIGVVFHALYFENKVGDPQFFCISDIGNSLSDCSRSMKKICIVEVFRSNIIKIRVQDLEGLVKILSSHLTKIFKLQSVNNGA